MRMTPEAFEKQNAQAIESYWHGLGYDQVRCDVISTGMKIPPGMHDDVVWKTVSNLINGLPPNVDPSSIRIPNWERQWLSRLDVKPLEWPSKSLLRGGRI